MFPHILPTRTATLSNSHITMTSVRTSLLVFPRFPEATTPRPNLDSANSIQISFYYGSDKTVTLNATVPAHLTTQSEILHRNNYITIKTAYLL
jgi:hypothetical protein